MRTLIDHAVDAGYPHEKHLEWAQEVGDEEIVERVRTALRAGG